MNTSTDVRVFKILSQAFLVLAVVVVGLYGYSELTGTDLALPWNITTSYFPKPLFLEYFKSDGKPVGFFVDQYVNWQQYGVGNIQHISWPGYLLLGSITICIWIISTAITYFSRFWYLITTGVLIVLVMQLNLREVEFWGGNNAYVAVALIIFSTYFFHAFKPNSSLTLRLVGIGGVMLLFYLSLYLFSDVPYSGLTIVNFGLYFPVLLLAAYLLLIGPDNIFSILKLTTTGNSGKTNLFHFILFGVIYISILVMMFLDKRGDLGFELIFINPTIFLVLSSVSSFICFDQKFEKYKGILPLTVLKQWVLPALFVLAISLIVFAKISINDPLVEAIDDFIIISHLALGAVYFVGAFINFTPLIIERLDVQKVYFKPKFAPGFLLGLASIGFLVALFFYSNFYPIYQLRAGFYNTKGDISEVKNELILAEQYYRQAVATDFVNFKSNIQVAKYDRKNKNAAGVIKSLDNTFFKNASPKGYSILTNYYNSREQGFNTMFALKDAIREIDSRELRNNLSFTYRQFAFYDSAYLMLRENWDDQNDNVTKNNLLALSTELIDLGNADSLIVELGNSDTRNKTNTVALANINNLSYAIVPELSPDTLLNQNDLFLLFNSALNRQIETNVDIISAIDFYLQSPYNNGLRKYLYLAKAISLYDLGKVTEAYAILDLLKNIDSQSIGFYYFVQGVWSIHQNQAILAEGYLENARIEGFDETTVLNVLEVVSSGKIPPYENRFALSLENYDVNQDSITVRNKLTQIARANAFDESTTIGAVNELQKWGVSYRECYEILLEAWNLNRFSVELGQAYILNAVETGISQYAIEGLQRIRSLMPPMAFSRFEETVKARIDEKRNQFFE